MIPCPICGGDSVLARSLPRDFIEAALRQYYSMDIPASAGLRDYELLRCTRCTLQFASPMIAGTDGFYDWLSRQNGYYPQSRGEWDQVIRALSTAPAGATLIEIGCGNGRFLELVRDRSTVSGIGLDITQNAVDECHRKGLVAHAVAIDAFIPDKPADFVVAFHCLEHVERPLELVKSMAGLLAPGGQIFIATPYSPMCFEGQWYDPMNHPPHHMSRWNAKSYRQLARQLGMQIEFIIEHQRGIPGRVLESLNLAQFGPGRPRQSRPREILRSLGHPIKLLREIVYQMRREKVDGKVSPDGVLVRLWREPPDSAPNQPAH